MRLGRLKTGAAIAPEHGQGVVVLIGGGEHAPRGMTVVDHPKDLAPCSGHGPDGDLLLFDAEEVDAVPIVPTPGGREAVVRSSS